ncbi:MAG: carbohydrate ABC transporter permease [Firmicutes bacterium]|nr:carbohydrate ABC transporter permease [Bacillota bacterium]NLY31155.1 carbohydrate ABC transporter permease [Bacillota bacterium]
MRNGFADRASKTLIYAILWLGVIVMIAPFIFMVVTSLEASANINLPYPPRFIPKEFTLSNYVQAMSVVPFGKYFYNSVVTGVSATVLQIFVSSLAAYAFAKGNFPGKNVLFVLLLATMMVPMQVTIIPMFDLMLRFRMINTYWALILPVVPSAYSTFLLIQFMSSIPDELIEAARIDGWSDWLIYRSLMLPLSKPAIATISMLTFVGIWNSFMWPLIVTSRQELYTLPLGLMNFRQQYTAQWGNLMAGATIAVVPVIAVFLCAQKYIIEGIAVSGLKA